MYVGNNAENASVFHSFRILILFLFWFLQRSDRQNDENTAFVAFIGATMKLRNVVELSTPVDCKPVT